MILNQHLPVAGPESGSVFPTGRPCSTPPAVPETRVNRSRSVRSRAQVEPGSVLWRAGEPCSYCVCVTEGTLHAMQPSRTAGKADRLACALEPRGGPVRSEHGS